MGRKLIVFALVAIMIFGFFGLSGCESTKVYETEHLKYTIWQSREVTIVGLTELGKQQKTVVIPDKIADKPVSFIGKNAKWGGPIVADFSSEKLEKIFFIASEISVPQGTFDGSINLQKIIVLNYSDFIFSSVGLFNYSLKHYVLAEIFERENFIEQEGINIANIRYQYNYETNINYGVYWIDDVDCGDKIEFIPANPIREGYTFAGWFLEPECVSQWDFNRVISQDTKLFAKWTEA